MAPKPPNARNRAGAAVAVLGHGMRKLGAPTCPPNPQTLGTAPAQPSWSSVMGCASWGPRHGPQPGKAPRSASPLCEVLRANEDLARLGAVAGAEDAILLHHVDEARRLRIAEPHAALQKRDRALALADDEVDGVPVEVIAIFGVAAVHALGLAL